MHKPQTENVYISQPFVNGAITVKNATRFNYWLYHLSCILKFSLQQNSYLVYLKLFLLYFVFFDDPATLQYYRIFLIVISV